METEKKQEQAEGIARTFNTLGYDASEEDFLKKYDDLLKEKEDDTLWQLIPPEYFSQTIRFLYYYFKKYKSNDECLDMMNDFCGKYKDFNKIQSCDLKDIHEMWGYFFSKKGDEKEAYNHFVSSVYNLLIDNNISGGDFEYFSFRRFSDFAWDDIKNNTLCLAYPGTFNDPMDTILFRWNKYMYDAAKDDAEKTFRLLMGKAYEHIKVRSFVRTSPLPDNFYSKDKCQMIEDVNPLMWAHYANDHKGFCIKYGFTSQTVANKDVKRRECTRVGNMVYKGEMIFEHEKNFKLTDALFAKHDIWKYENEVRIINFDPSNQDNYKTINLPEDSIKEIYLGIRCSDENRDKMKLVLRNRNIRLYQMKIDEKDCYKLVKERIL